MNERHARSRGEENLAALLCRLLQPSLADQRLEALDDRVQLGPVGKDVVGEGFRETANFDKADVFGQGRSSPWSARQHLQARTCGAISS